MVSSLSDYKPVSTLDNRQQQLLDDWWKYFQSESRASLFRTWWVQDEVDKCCGAKTIVKSSNSWPESKYYACKTCLTAKKGARPCLRLNLLKGSDGSTIRVVEVLPQEGVDEAVA